VLALHIPWLIPLLTRTHRRVWDTGTGQCLRTLVHEDNPGVTSVCFSPNSRYILAFTLDNCIRLWDYVAGSVKKTYQGHQNEKFAIGGCFGVWRRHLANETIADEDEARSDQAIIASASEDGSIVLWDVKSKVVVQELKGHAGVCFWVDINGGIMASGGQDGMVKVYQDSTRRQAPGQTTATARTDSSASPAEGVEKERLADKVAAMELEERDGDMESEEMTADVQIKQEEAEASGGGAMMMDVA
jgi:WD40 repeat protein